MIEKSMSDAYHNKLAIILMNSKYTKFSLDVATDVYQIIMCIRVILVLIS